VLVQGILAGVGLPRAAPAPAGGRSPAGWGRSSTGDQARYFCTHLFVTITHTPLAFSQSAGVVYFAKSSEICDGLAEGELDGSPDAPGVVVGLLDPLDAPGAVLFSLPEDDPAPGPPAPSKGLFGLVLPGAPLLTCAAAKAGAKATIPTKSGSVSFCIWHPSAVEFELMSDAQATRGGRPRSGGLSFRIRPPGEVLLEVVDDTLQLLLVGPLHLVPDPRAVFTSMCVVLERLVAVKALGDVRCGLH
jgi:hypothetical protein